MKLFRKIRQSLIKEGNLKRYLLYALGEILLVMIGISLAFQVNNWNDNRTKKASELRYYENIKEQIKDDKGLILEQMELNNGFGVQFNYANKILESNDRSKMDTLGLIARNLTQYTDFDRQGNIYETMVNSGEVKLLRNHQIINGLRLLEEKYLYINRMENIHYDAMMKYVVPSITPVLRFSNGTIVDPDKVYDFKFQNLVVSLLQIMNEKDKVYNEALSEIEMITALIDEELKRD
ncbi:DUF6090 family protein [Ulvibacterium marinum]|uniref:Uncharacterized protein n=1 Tax=Ulvibacterium marinum TaxID=2419782 RepID=A0A3B0CAN0_9FLAO|nr:DUF6090 family protein [Ulvibacterium marinum]RKN81694.1 hypothetical protein D7Z94_12400 [Ulvibacterium marinum]